jgi:hypothetical protein
MRLKGLFAVCLWAFLAFTILWSVAALATLVSTWLLVLSIPAACLLTWLFNRFVNWASQPKDDRRLACRLGMHRWYLDNAMFSSVERCNHCPAVDDKYDASRMDYERYLWEQNKDLPFEVACGKVARDLTMNSPSEAGFGQS